MNLSDYIKNNRLEIIVKPNSPKNEITGYDESRGALKVDIKARAEDNKANVEAMKFFSRLTHRSVSIISGFKNKRKILYIPP